MNYNKNRMLLIGAMTMSLAFASCVDNSYDLDDVDMTIGSNIDLVLPGCSTGAIQLRNIMDLKEDGVVKLVQNPNGGDDIYVVAETGTANIDPIKINQIRIKRPDINPFDASVNLREMFGGGNPAKRKLPVKVNVGGTDYTLNIEDQSYHYDLKVGDARQQLSGSIATGISSDVVSIEHITCDEVEVKLDLAISGFPSYIQKIHLDNLVLTLPSELEVTSCQLNGKDAISIEPGKIVLTKPVDDARSNDKLVLSMKVKGVSTGQNFIFNGEDHRAELSGLFDVMGTFRIETSEMDGSAMSPVIQAAIANMTMAEQIALMNGGKLDATKIEGLIPENVLFHGEAGFSNDITITHVTGVFQHEVGDISPIKLDDLPDFLDDPEVVLDLENPMVFLNTTSDIPAAATTRLTLTSKLKDGSVVRQTDKLELLGSKTFYMANDFANLKYWPANYQKNQVIAVPLFDPATNKAADVTGLIKKVPKQIEIGVDKVLLTATDLDITKPYNVGVDYEVYAPLSFGPEFYLVYQDTENDLDLGDDMDDVDFSKDMAISINMDVESTLPAAFTLSVDPRDVYGQSLKSLEPINIVVPAPTTGGSVSKQNVTVQLKPKAGYSLNDALHSGENQLDAIHYKATLKGAEGQVLQGSGSVTLKNIKVSVKGQVSIDAN